MSDIDELDFCDNKIRKYVRDNDLSHLDFIKLCLNMLDITGAYLALVYKRPVDLIDALVEKGIKREDAEKFVSCLDVNIQMIDKLKK